MFFLNFDIEPQLLETWFLCSFGSHVATNVG